MVSPFSSNSRKVARMYFATTIFRMEMTTMFVICSIMCVSSIVSQTVYFSQVTCKHHLRLISRNFAPVSALVLIRRFHELTTVTSVLRHSDLRCPLTPLPGPISFITFSLLLILNRDPTFIPVSSSPVSTVIPKFKPLTVLLS